MQGICGVYSRKGVGRKALHLLYGVQHRGQESSGISVAGDHSLRTWKGKGLVSNVFDERYASFIHPEDYLAIACTSGESNDRGWLPPIQLESEHYNLSLAVDGYFLGLEEILGGEAFGNALLHNLEQFGTVQTAIYESMKGFSQAYYSIVIALHHKKEERSEFIAVRDSRGVRPLYLATNADELFVASESAPIDVLESMGDTVDDRRDLLPGAMIEMNDEGFVERQVLEPRPAHCAFEWVYFGRPDSVIEERSVHEARKRLGHALVDIHSLRKLYGTEMGPREDMVVIPVPDSGRSVCIGVAEALGVPADEGVIKNPYLGRTYIIDDPEFRKIASDLKHNIIKKTVEDKKVIITDDSIVRGTVSDSIAQNLLKAGATEVDFLVSYAPIFHPCFPDPADKPLAAAPFQGKNLSEIGKLVAANLQSINNVKYNSVENVIKAIGLSKTDLCTMCIGGKNPFQQEMYVQISISNK